MRLMQNTLTLVAAMTALSALGLDPSCVRERVARYRAAQRARPGASRGAAAGSCSAARISPRSRRTKYS